MAATRRHDLAIAAGIALAWLLLDWPTLRDGIAIADEGWLITGVERVLGGEVLYRDFVRSYAPAVYYVPAALLRFSSDDLFALRVLLCLLLACTGAAAFLLPRPHLPRLLALLPAVALWALGPPRHKAFVPLAFVLSLHLCRRVLERSGSLGALALCGVGFGLVALVRQEAAAFGIAISAATVACTPAGRRALPAAWGALAGGAACVWLPVAVALAWAGGLGAAVEQLVVAGLRGNAGMSLPLPGLAELRASPLLLGLFYLPSACVVLGGWVGLRAAGTARGRLLLQWTAMLLLAHMLFVARTDFGHLKQILVVAALVGVAALGAALASPMRHRASGRLALAACALATGWLVAGSVLAFVDRTSRRLSRPTVRLETPGGFVRVPPRQAELLHELVTGIRSATQPGEEIFVAPYSPMLYFLSERRNATPIDAIFPGLASPEIEADIVSRLSEQEVATVVYKDVFYDGRPERSLRHFAPILWATFARDYRERLRVGPFVVLERRAY